MSAVSRTAIKLMKGVYEWNIQEAAIKNTYTVQMTLASFITWCPVQSLKSKVKYVLVEKGVTFVQQVQNVWTWLQLTKKDFLLLEDHINHTASWM